jgi:hypothetical protein
MKMAAKTFAEAGKLSRVELLSGVREYAATKGTENGWDFVLGWDDEVLDKKVGIRTKSVLGAVQMITMLGGIREANDARLAEMVEAHANGEAEVEEVPAPAPVVVTTKKPKGKKAEPPAELVAELSEPSEQDAS